MLNDLHSVLPSEAQVLVMQIILSNLQLYFYFSLSKLCSHNRISFETVVRDRKEDTMMRFRGEYETWMFALVMRYEDLEPLR